MTKAWLSKQGVPFIEHNISTDESARNNLLAMGYRTTPVTTIGKDIIVGYSIIRLQASIEAHNFK